MVKFPEPPDRSTLEQLGPAIVKFPRGTLLWRIYFRGGAHKGSWDGFRHWGPHSGRFDHHLPPSKLQTRGILYAAHEIATCFAEVFQASRTIDRNDRDPWLTGFKLARQMNAHDVSGAWSTRSGASTEINSGQKARARRWSRAVYDAYPTADAILYGSSMDAFRPSLAMFERAKRCVPKKPAFDRALNDPSMATVVDAAAERFGYLVI